jgi:hypothetical protein
MVYLNNYIALLCCHKGLPNVSSLPGEINASNVYKVNSYAVINASFPCSLETRFDFKKMEYNSAK